MDRNLMRMLRELDEYELRRLIMFARGLLAGTDGPGYGAPDDVGAGSEEPRKRYRQQMVRCGKQGCTRCPHGPYWYAYWRENGKARTSYVGKDLPEGVEP